LNEVVLDASAVIALLREEPGCAIVEKHLSRAALSTVNLSEVMTKFIQSGMPENLAISIIASLGLRIVDFNEELAQAAARLTANTSKVGLSLGDRACLALAQHLGLSAVTADRNWAKLSMGIEIKLIR
jgi:PIN domain nuclease of toxin-antitoxin system